MIVEPNDSWATVELYRWQYGHLPGEDGKPERPLNYPIALTKMADAIEAREMKNFPSPMGVISVLRHVAKIMESKK